MNNTVPVVEAATTAKVATPTNDETPGASSVTSKGQSQIANSQIVPEEVQLPAAEDAASSSVQIASEEVQLPATEDVASQQMAIDMQQQQRTPGKFEVAIDCGVFNCVAGFDV